MNKFHCAGIAFAAIVVASTAFTASAAPTDAQACLAAKEKALSKLESCVWKAQAKAAQTSTTADAALCYTKFNEAWAKPNAKYGSDCPAATATTISGLFDEHVAEVLSALGGGSGGACDISTQACPASEGCYPVADNDNQCLTAGTTAIGDLCTNVNDCVEGAACFSTGGESRCFELCEPSAPACSDGECAPVDGLTDVGACVVI